MKYSALTPGAAVKFIGDSVLKILIISARSIKKKYKTNLYRTIQKRNWFQASTFPLYSNTCTLLLPLSSLVSRSLTARAYLNTQKFGLFCSLQRWRNLPSRGTLSVAISVTNCDLSGRTHFMKRIPPQNLFSRNSKPGSFYFHEDIS